jgi:Trk K+ transport system NAD-binding subunit
MGLILSTTSLGIVVPVLKEHSQTSNTYGQTLITTALISDFATLLLLRMVIAILSRGLTLDLLLFMVLLGAFVTMAKISQWANRIPLLARIGEELAHATAQIRVRGAFALMVIWVVLAEALGLEVILGAFLAGAIMSLSSPGQESQLRMKLDAIGYGFFIPIFFITVGAGFDLGSLLASRSSLYLVFALIAAAYLIKLLPALLYRVRFSWRQSVAAGALLSSRLSLIIAVSAITLELGLISGATNAALIVVAIVTCTLSPFIFSRILPHETEPVRKGVIILGTDQLATLLGIRLRQAGDSVTYIDRDVSALEKLHRDGFTCIPGDPRDETVWERAGAQTVRALIAVSRAPKSLLVACQLAQERFRIPTIIARADNPQLVSTLQSMNISVVQPAMAVALALEGALHFPAAFNVLMDKGDNVEVLDVPLENPACFGRPLRHLRLPGDALVLGIQRQGEVVVPHGDTVLHRDDVLMLVGNPESLEEGRRWLASSPA